LKVPAPASNFLIALTWSLESKESDSNQSGKAEDYQEANFHD